MKEFENRGPLNVVYTAKLALTLLLITGVVAVMLGGVNYLTADRIADIAAEKRAQAMAEVLPGYSVDGESWQGELGEVTQLKNGADVAWCVSTAPKGFGGDISMTVSVMLSDDGTLNVGKVSIVSHAETMGNPRDEAFLGQYSGLTHGIGLGDGDNNIDAMTGATVSSKAITLGVNNALDAVREALDAGVFPEESGVN